MIYNLKNKIKKKIFKIKYFSFEKIFPYWKNILRKELSCLNYLLNAKKKK